MSALAEGLGPLASIIAPVRDSQVLPLGISVTERWVDLAWNASDRDTPPVGPLPKMTSFSSPPGWTGGRGIRLDSHPVFAWKTMHEQLREGLKHVLDARQLFAGLASLQAEADWCLAIDLFGRSSLRTDPITVREIRDRIAPRADADDRSSLQHGGHPAVRLGDVRELLRRLQEQGQTAVTCPWPAPDRLHQGIDWLPHLWSPEALQQRAEQVGATALACYKATVDHWLSRFAPHLRLAAAWPVRVTGFLMPGNPTLGMDAPPTFFWTIISNTDNPGADFQLVDDFTSGDVRAIASEWQRYSEGELPGIYGLTPAADLAARLLWNDLKEWEWVAGVLRRRH